MTTSLKTCFKPIDPGTEYAEEQELIHEAHEIHLHRFDSKRPRAWI